MFLFKKVNYFLIIKFTILFCFLNISKAAEVEIIYKVNNDIITNIDIENEYRYLIALNEGLKQMDKDRIIEFSKDSILKEKVKKNELIKFVELDKKNETVDLMIKNIYEKLGIKSETEFKNYLTSFNLKFLDIYRKIEIETVWNELIYRIYKDKIIINEDELIKKIENSNQKTQTFLLSELLFNFKDKNEINKKYLEIIENIKSKGFKESVIKYSIADSKNNFGLIGWINKNTLSNEIQAQVNGLNIGEISKPIIVPGGILLLKLEDKKEVDLEINVDKELDKAIRFEMNRQLNNYSIIHYNKTKKSLSINEY